MCGCGLESSWGVVGTSILSWVDCSRLLDGSGGEGGVLQSPGCLEFVFGRFGSEVVFPKPSEGLWIAAAYGLGCDPWSGLWSALSFGV